MILQFKKIKFNDIFPLTNKISGPDYTCVSDTPELYLISDFAEAPGEEEAQCMAVESGLSCRDRC
jgi:hypothetical protein